MKLIRAVLLFPAVFFLVGAIGDAQVATPTEGATGGTQNPEVVAKAGEVGFAVFKRQLDFMMNLNEAVLTREEETRKKLLVAFPLFGEVPFKDSWADLKDLLKKVTDLRVVLVKGHTLGAKAVVPQENGGTDRTQEKDALKTAVNVFEIFGKMACDLVQGADKAVRTVSGMDPNKALGFQVTPETGEALFLLLPGMYDTLKELLKLVEEWVGAKSYFEERRMFHTAGDGKPKQHLRKFGLGDEELKGETTLEELKGKLEPLVGKDKPFEKVLCALAGYALMRTPEGTTAKQAWLLLLSQAMGNEAMKAKVKKAVNDVTGKGEVFVDELKKLNTLAPLAKEQVPKQYRFPGEYADLEVHHFWTVLTGVFGTLLDDINKAAAQPTAGEGVAHKMAELVKPNAALGNLAAQVTEIAAKAAVATDSNDGQAKADVAPALVKQGKEGQVEDGAYFGSIGMAAFCLSVAVAVF